MTQEEHEARIKQCRDPSCRAPIVFLPTRNGKRMPVDAHTVEPGDVEFDRECHQSHFRTCTAPDLAAWRNRG